MRILNTSIVIHRVKNYIPYLPMLQSPLPEGETDEAYVREQQKAGQRAVHISTTQGEEGVAAPRSSPTGESNQRRDSLHHGEALRR